MNRFDTLTAEAQLVAKAYGAIAPSGLSASRMADLLQSVGIRFNKRNPSKAKIREINGELLSLGICVGDGDAYYSNVFAAREWTNILARKSADNNFHNLFLNAYKKYRRDSHYGYARDEKLHKAEFRYSLLNGCSDQLPILLDKATIELDDWQILAEPFDHELVSAVPSQYLDTALSACLLHVIETAAPAEPVISACKRLSSNFILHASKIAFIWILQGQFKEAKAVYEGLSEEVLDSKLARTGSCSIKALVAMLVGDNRAASHHINAAIDGEKAGTRKRIVFPDHSSFTLSLLALVRLNEPESYALLRQLASAFYRLNCTSATEYLLVADALTVQSQEGIHDSAYAYPSLQLLFNGFRKCWLGSNARLDDKWLRALRNYRSRAEVNGWRWIEAECTAVLNHLGGKSRSRGADSREVTDLHDALGTQTLAILERPMSEWERSLKALEHLAYYAKAKQGRTSSASGESEKRLVWQVTAHLDYGYASPILQTRYKNGKWSKGRKVALKRLANEIRTMKFARDEDVAAVAEIEVCSNWSGEKYLLGASGVYALAGHPFVIDDAGDPIDIVRLEPELRVDWDKGHNVTVTIEPRPLDTDTEYVLRSMSGGRIEVSRHTKYHQTLFELIPPEGLKFPVDRKSRLLEAVSALVSEVRVQSTAGSVTGVTEVTADAQPWVRLEPFQEGLSVALLVEPIPETGTSFEPGHGGGISFAHQDGTDIQAHRDLQAELLAVSRLVDSCPLLSSKPTESTPLLLSEPEDCLELLEQLHIAEARCKWPRGEPFRVIARHSASALSLSMKTADQWLKASGELSVDERTVLNLKQLFDLLQASPGSRFLELKKGQFLALSKTFRQQLEDFRSLSAPESSGAMRLHSLAAASLGGFFEETAFKAGKGWRTLRGNLESARSFEPRLPSTLQAELRSYQLDGFRWLARLSRWGGGACLADDMGLGKTVQALSVLLERAPSGPSLVVSPTSVVANWVDEARRFAPTLNVKTYTGNARSRSALLADSAPFDLYLTTYGLLQNDIEQLETISWNSVVLDEAQAIKNSATKRARAARKIVSDFRLATTGTPIQNNLMDLHSLFSFLNPGLLGSRDRFRKTFAEPVENRGDEEARGRLKRTVAPFILRRLKSEVLDELPERTEITLHVELSAEEAALYEMLRRKAVEQLAASGKESAPGETERFQLLAHLTRLRLACCNPKLVRDSPAEAPKSSKLETFAVTLDELLANRHKTLVFSQFVMHLKLIEEYLIQRGISYQYLDGGTSERARAERIADFQAGNGDVFLISLKAGGTGLNLTAADYVIHMDPWWNPAVEDQASNRVHRIGQTRPVTVYRLVTKGTIEEQIVDLHRHKRDLADRLLEGTDTAARLTTDELLELLRDPISV